MVRETRYLLVGNLPEKISEDALLDHFKRYGKIQSVKLHKKDGSEEGISATVAFGDIKSASKAHGSENHLEGSLLTTEYSEGSVSGSAVTRTVEPSPVRSSPYSRQFPARSKGSEEGESFENRDFHYSPGQYEGRYSQGSSGYGEEAFQRGRPRERFIKRGSFKQYDSRGGYHSRPTNYKAFDQSSQDGFEKPKIPQSPAHSTSHSSSRHSSKHKRRKKKNVSRSKSRSRSRSSSSSSSSRSSSESSGSRSSSGSSRSSSHKRKLQSAASQIKTYRTESQDSVGSDHGGGKSSESNKTRGLLIKNLPQRSSDTSLRDGLFHDFKKYGKINAVLVTGQTEDRYAIVSYRKAEDAEKALHNTQGKVFFGAKIKTSLTDGIEVDDNELRPPEAELDEHHPKATRTLFVGNLEKDISNEELRERFSKFGTILDIDVKRQGAVSAYAFVQFTDISSVVKVLRELEGEVWGSMKLKLGFGKSMPTSCIWLDNVDQTVQENFLCRQFMRYGQVTHGIIDRIRGRSLVFFVNQEMAQYALNEMRNRILNNRKIIIDFASRDCQTEFFEKMEKTGQLKPGMRPDERRGWMYNRQSPDGQWEATYDNRGSFYKFPFHQGGPPSSFRGGRGRGIWGGRGGSSFGKDSYGEEYRRTRSYEDYGRFSGGPDGDFDQDLRAYQRERREHGSPSPSQYSEDPYGERYGKGYYKYPESYRSGSPVSDRAYDDFEYGKHRPDEKYFKERYPDVEFPERRGYSPEGRSWSRSPTHGMPSKESYGRNTPPTPMDDELNDFSSHDNSPEEERHGKYSEAKEKRRKSGDDFMINEADIAEINRSSKYHAGYRKGQESQWSEERYDRKRSYEESFSHEYGQSPNKLDRQLSRGSKSSLADSKRDIYQKVQKIQSKITEKLKKGKNDSSPSSGSSESGELTEGELSKLQSEKQALLDKIKNLEKDSSNSDIEEGLIEDDRRKASKRPRLESDIQWDKNVHGEMTNAKGYPKKSLSYDSSLSLRKQMDHLRKIDESKIMEEKNKAYSSGTSRTNLDTEGSEEDFSSMLSPKDIPASFKKRKKYEMSDEKRSYRLKRADEEMSSDNDDGKNLSRTDSLSSNPVFRRMSSGHSSPRTPVAPHSQELAGEHHRHSESDMSAGEGHSSITMEESSKKKSGYNSKTHGAKSKHRHKEEHHPTIIPLGEDEINTDMLDPRNRILFTEQICLPLPRFAELDLQVMTSPDAENSEERLKSESPCFSPPSSGSKNTNSPQRSPSESVSADSQEPLQPEYIPEDGMAEVPSEDQLLGKTKEKSEFDSDDGLSDGSDHLDTFGSDDKLSLEERIRRLDEKLNAVSVPTSSTKPVSDISSPMSINSGTKSDSCNSTLSKTQLYSKFRISKRQDVSGNGVDSKSEGPDITQTVVSRKISIFDQDTKRLEQISEKYSPKPTTSTSDDPQMSMPLMTKAAVKEMPLATLPGSLTGRLGNSAAFPTLSINTSTANQTGLKPDEMFSSPTSEISSPSPAFTNTQEKPLWQMDNFTGSPKLLEPNVTAFSSVPKMNFLEQTHNNSGSVISNLVKEDLAHKPFITPAVKKQMGIHNVSEENSVYNNLVYEDKLLSKQDNRNSPHRNDIKSLQISPKSDFKLTKDASEVSDVKSECNVSVNDTRKSNSPCDKNKSDVSNCESMDVDTSVICDKTKGSDSIVSSKNITSDSHLNSKLSNHVAKSDSEKLSEVKDSNVAISVKISESSENSSPLKVVKQNSSVTNKEHNISKGVGSKDHIKKPVESVEDILGLNSPVVLGKRKAETEDKTKSASTDKSSVKENINSDNTSSESESPEKETPDKKKAKLSKSESSSSETDKSDASKNKVVNKDVKKKESKKKESCEGDAVKKDKNNGEKRDKDRDGNSGKGNSVKSSSSGDKSGSSGKASSKSQEKPQNSGKSNSVKPDEKAKPNSEKKPTNKSDEKSKVSTASVKSDDKNKVDEKPKSEKSNDLGVKKPSEKKSEHKKEQKLNKSADNSKGKEKDKTSKEGQAVKPKAKDDQSATVKSSKSDKSVHSDKSTKDGLNKHKKDSNSDKTKEGCKPKEESKERSHSFDSPSKSKDPKPSDSDAKSKERLQPMSETDKSKGNSTSNSTEGHKDNKNSEGKSEKVSKHGSALKPGEKSKSKDHVKHKVKDKQASIDKSAKEGNKEKSSVKADESTDRKASDIKTEQRTESTESKSDNTERKASEGDRSTDNKNNDNSSDNKNTDKSSDNKNNDKSSDNKNTDKGSDNKGNDKSGNTDGKLEMKNSDERKHDKKKSSDSSKVIKKTEKLSHKDEGKSQKIVSQKSKSDEHTKNKGDHNKSKVVKSHSDKQTKVKSIEKSKKGEKESKEVKSLNINKKKDKSDDSFDSVKSPEQKKPATDDDFDWDAWQEPYVSMYDKVKRRSTIKDQEREREREMEKTRERLDRLQEKRQKKTAKQKNGKPYFRSDDGSDSDFSDEDDMINNRKDKKKNTNFGSIKKKPSQIYSSSSESDYDFEEPLFPIQKKAQAKPRVQQPLPKKKKKASILDIYSSDSEASSDSSFGGPHSNKKPKTPKRDPSIEREDMFGLKNRTIDVKKKTKKDVVQKPETKQPAKKSFNEIFTSSDSDSDTDPAIQESPKPIRPQKPIRPDNRKSEKLANKIYSSSDSDSMDEIFMPAKQALSFPEKTKDKTPQKAKSPKKQDNNNKKKKVNNVFDDTRSSKSLVTTQTVLEKDLPVSRGDSLFDQLDSSIPHNNKKEKSAKNIRRKEKENIIVEGKLEIGKEIKKPAHSVGLFEKMETYHIQQKSNENTITKDVPTHNELKSSEKKAKGMLDIKDVIEKPKKKKDSKKKKESTSDNKVESKTSSAGSNVSPLEKGIIIGENEKVENNVIVEEIPVEDSFLVEASVQDENSKNMWDSGVESMSKRESNTENKLEAPVDNSSSDINEKSFHSGSVKKTKKNKEKTDEDGIKKMKKKDKIDKEGKSKKKKKPKSISDMDRTIDDVSKGKDLLSSPADVDKKTKDKADSTSTDHSDNDLDFSTPLFENFVPAIIKPARQSLKDKAVSDKNDKETEKQDLSVSKESDKPSKTTEDENKNNSKVDTSKETIKNEVLEEKPVDTVSVEKKPTSEELFQGVSNTEKVDINKPDQAQIQHDEFEKPSNIQSSVEEILKTLSDSGPESEMSFGICKPANSQIPSEKKSASIPKDGFSLFSPTKSSAGLVSSHGLLSPPLPKNGSLVPCSQSSVLSKNPVLSTVSKFGKLPTKNLTTDESLRKNKKEESTLKKSEFGLKKTKGADVFEFQEEDSDGIEPLNFKHRHGDTEKSKTVTESKGSLIHNDVSGKICSTDSTAKPKETAKSFAWDIPSLDKFPRRPVENKPKSGVHHEQESLFANWAKTLTGVKNKPNPFENMVESMKGPNKKQPKKKQPQKSISRSPVRNESNQCQASKVNTEKEVKGSAEDLARDNFGFDLLTKDTEEVKIDKEKEKPPVTKDVQEETLEAVSSLQNLTDNADKDKDQFSEDDALVIDESVNTAEPAPEPAADSVPPHADNETALAIQSILSFDEDKPQEPEISTPAAPEPEVSNVIEPIIPQDLPQMIIPSQEDQIQQQPSKFMDHVQQQQSKFVDQLQEQPSKLLSLPKPDFSAAENVSQPASVIQRNEPVIPPTPAVPMSVLEQLHSPTTSVLQPPTAPVLQTSVTPVLQPPVPVLQASSTPVGNAKPKKPRSGKKQRKSAKSPIQAIVTQTLPEVENLHDLHNRDDSDEGALHIATDSPKPVQNDQQFTSQEQVHTEPVSVGQTAFESEPQPKVLSPLHISLTGTSLFEKPERQSRPRRKKNGGKTQNQVPNVSVVEDTSKDTEAEPLSDFGSPNMSSEKNELPVSDSERTDEGESNFGDEGIDSKRPRRGGRKPKNYKELSGIAPRTNSPRSRTSPRSPRGASPKADIASPVVKIERLSVSKDPVQEEEVDIVKEQQTVKDCTPIKDLRRGRSAIGSEQKTDIAENQSHQKVINVFDFDANEAEEKNENNSAPVPIPKRRSSGRRKKGSSEGLDGTVLTSEIKETGIKISIARTPAPLQRNNSQDQSKEKSSDAKKTSSPTLESKTKTDIPIVPTIEPEKRALKPRDMMNAEGRSRSNSTVREEPISITIPKSKFVPSLPVTTVTLPSPTVITQPTDAAVSMSNIDRIIDNVSKGIFDEAENVSLQPDQFSTPLTIDVGVMDKKRAASRHHDDDLSAQQLKSPQLISPANSGLRNPSTTMSVVSPLMMTNQAGGLMRSPHQDVTGMGVNNPLLPMSKGSSESVANSNGTMEEEIKKLMTPTATSSPIQNHASAIITLANKFDTHMPNMMGGTRFPPPVSLHIANTTVVMTTTTSPLVSTGMPTASQHVMGLNMSKHVSSSAVKTAVPNSVATTVLSTAANSRTVIASSHSHLQSTQQSVSNASSKFQHPDPVPSSVTTTPTEKRSNSLDRLQQSVTSAPTCVVHPITTTSLTSKQQQAAQAAQMMQLRMAEPRLNQMQALLQAHGDPKAVLDGLTKEQLCAVMENRLPLFHPMAAGQQHVIQHMANQKAFIEMQKQQESLVKQAQVRNQKNQEHGKDSQRPPSAHSNPKQSGNLPDRPCPEQFGFPPMSFQDQIRAQFSKGIHPQMWAHLHHQMKQLEEKKLHADPKSSSPNMIHQPSSVIAATVASQHGQHPQIKSPALAQTAPSPHQVGPTFTQAHSLQRPPSPVKKGADKQTHGNRWQEGNNIPAHEGQRSRPPSHDAERTSPHDHWVYGQAPKPAHQPQEHVPMSQKERLMQRQKEDQQRELQLQQDLQREKEKKRQQELQWQKQIEERVRQEVAPAHSQGRRDSQSAGTSGLSNQATDLRQTALVPGQQRMPGQGEKEIVDPCFGQHPGMSFPADLRRPSSQNPSAFTPSVSGGELSPGLPAHLTPDMQHIYQERMLAMGHHIPLDPIRMQQLLASGIPPHFLAHGGIPVDHQAIAEGRSSTQTSQGSRDHGPTGKMPSQESLIHMHESRIHGLPARPLHDGPPPPAGEGSLLSSLQRYPVMWQGVLALKNDQCVVQLHLINGFNQLVKLSLPQTSPDGTVQPLRIAQRMRLEAAQLEGVVKRMQFDQDYCMLLALPCGRDHEDIINQTRAMSSGFIQYLQQKQAAGIVNVPEPETSQPAYVVHIFPPCEFSHDTLGRLGFDLLHQVRDLAHLLVIITTVA